MKEKRPPSTADIILQTEVTKTHRETKRTMYKTSRTPNDLRKRVLSASPWVVADDELLAIRIFEE